MAFFDFHFFGRAEIWHPIERKLGSAHHEGDQASEHHSPGAKCYMFSKYSLLRILLRLVLAQDVFNCSTSV